MGRDPKDRVTAGQRAGLPLARAQRLAVETQKRAKRGRASVLYGVSLLGVAGLVGLGVMSTTSETVTGTAPSVATAAPVPSQPTVASAQTPATVAPSAPIVVTLPVDPANPTCVQMVETHLNTLYRTSAEDADWTGRQDAVATLIQAALDCDDTSLKITGSLELAGTNLADIRVRWGREDWTLDLAMVDIVGPGAVTDAAEMSNDSFEFVVR